MIYEDIMTPIEMLSNSNRLSVTSTPSVYEPNLKTSMMMKSNSIPEYKPLMEDKIFQLLINDLSEDDYLLGNPQIFELLSEPIPVCQFHTVEVISYSLYVLETM